MIKTDLVYSDLNGQLIVIMNNVVQRLLSYRQIGCFSKESAGVLIGERRGVHIVICDLSVPGSGDIRRRYSVDRRGAHHQDKVCDAFWLSKGTQQYLGEWHTHPEDNPKPSPRDLQSWRENIDSSESMIVLIVGRQKLWVGKKDVDTITQLRLVGNLPIQEVVSRVIPQKIRREQK